MKSIEVNDQVADIIRDGKKLLKHYFSNISFPFFENSETLVIKNNNNLMAITETKISSQEINKVDDKDVILKVLRVVNVN